MTVLEICCLETLREIGPSSNADVARKLGVSSSTTYRGIQSLVIQGFATHPKKQEWIATRLGLARLEESLGARPTLKLMEVCDAEIPSR